LAITSFAVPEGFLIGVDYRIHAPGYDTLSFSWGEHQRPVLFSVWPSTIAHTLSQGQQHWPLQPSSDPKSEHIDLCLKADLHLDELLEGQNLPLPRRLLLCLGVCFLALCFQFYFQKVYLPLLAVLLFSICPSYSKERRWQVAQDWISDQKGEDNQKWFSFKKGDDQAVSFFRSKGPRKALWDESPPQHSIKALPASRFHIEKGVWGHVLYIHFEPSP
jgi:hypothetical protein